MSKTQGTFTVFFDGQFWTGVFENVTREKLSVCKVTFGAEPKPSEIYDFILAGYSRLKLQQESMKIQRHNVRRENREKEKQYQFELKQQKKKAKHKGR